MKRRFLIVFLSLLAVSAALLSARRALAGPPDKWVHVRVVETGEDGETVRVNVPITLVEALLPILRKEEWANTRIRFDDRDITVQELRAIHEALGAAPDGEFITVESKDEHVRVKKDKGHLIVKVNGKQGDEQVDVKMPMSVVAALLSGEEEELDLAAGIRALGDEGDGELVAVADGETVVRIWVDGEPTPEPESAR